MHLGLEKVGREQARWEVQNADPYIHFTPMVDQ